MKRIVVKVGTSTLTRETGELDCEYISSLARQICGVRETGAEVVLVSSGAIRAGMERLGQSQRPVTIPEKQAVAAVGQGLLMRTYHDLFAECGLIVGQVLLTRDDIADRRRYLNARNTLNALLDLGIVPIVNENDTIAVDEIKFGDNDTLAALVGLVVEADAVVLFTDVEGFYRDPSDPQRQPIPRIPKITREIESLAGGAGTDSGTGGMVTKIRAAKIAVNSGISFVICHGCYPDALRRIVEGEQVGTFFEGKPNSLKGRKRWIAFGSAVHGTLTVNEGARDALITRGKSLLPAGIEDITGNFAAGDLVRIVDGDGKEFARGLSNYSSVEVRAIRGIRTTEIEKVLGYSGFDEVVHRDNLVVGVG